ncbi:MAG: gliding motility-associated C-terminal protein [Flavipsychrobacter sp.]|jgi:gliding motility-associated-like protein|nr:gliding motility-associated C-terminal protein [Flavipsychrobacter sp.]
MKRVLCLLALIIVSINGFAQTPAPIVGSSLVCMGSPTVLTNPTTGGIWSSSNPSVATVGATSGAVNGVALGSVIITYAISTGFVTKLMTVKNPPTISPASVFTCVNSSTQMEGFPAGGSWGTASPSIATINFLGVVTGMSAGVTTITYTEAGGCAGTAPITVNPIPLPITGTNYVYQGLTTSLADLTPGGTWSSSNTSLATVGAGTGIVTGVSAGLVLISYTLPTTCAAFMRVEVNPLPATANLYAWYPFCGDTTDKSGNGRDLINHGITTTPATLTTDRFGNANNAYLFNGSTSMMNYTTFFPNAGTPPDFTYSCWINIPVNQSSIIWYNGIPGVNGFGMVVNSGTLGVPGDQVGIVFGASPVVNASQAVTLGVWHNLVLVKNGGVYNFYIDNAPGVFFLETTAPVFGGASSVFAMGMNYPSSLGAGPLTDAFNGAIDDFAYITRQLSNAERLSIFNFNPDASSFTLGNDTTICSDRAQLIPDPQTVGARYEWSRYNGLGYTVLDTVDTTLIVYPVSGSFGNEYVLKVSKPYGCVVSDTIVVYKAPIPVNLGPDQHICVGDTVTLSNFFPSAHFLWSTGDTAHSIEVTTTGTYYVTVDSAYLGSVCVGRDTIKVNFHPVPIIGLPEDVKHCSGEPDTLRAHKDPIYTYFWSTGVTADSLVVTASGSYWVRVSDSGCIRYDTTNVLIVFDTVTFNFRDTALCRGEPLPTAGWVTFNPIVTYHWTPTAGIALPNTPNPVIIADTPAVYVLTVRYPGCPDLLDSFHLDIQPNPSVFIGGNRHVCEGDTIHVHALIDPGWYSKYIYSWTPSTGLDCTTCSSIVLTGTDTFTLYLTVTTPAWDATKAPGYCMSRDSATIFSHPRHFDTLAPRHELCPGDSVQLFPYDTTLAGVIHAGYDWSPGRYLDDSTSAMPWVHPINSISYLLISTSNWGCRDTNSVDIYVHAAATIEMEDSVIIYPGESHHIQPQTNCTHFAWYPPLGLSNVHVSDPVARPDVNTVYIVNALTEFGCAVTDSFKVRIDPNSLLAMPNAFAPNSFNNKFMPVKRGIVELHYFRVFDRWGVLMFETNNINDGWDGTYKGKMQPFGVYVYELEAITNTGKFINRRGNVTLIK